MLSTHPVAETPGTPGRGGSHQNVVGERLRLCGEAPVAHSALGPSPCRRRPPGPCGFLWPEGFPSHGCWETGRDPALLGSSPYRKLPPSSQSTPRALGGPVLFLQLCQPSHESWKPELTGVLRVTSVEQVPQGTAGPRAPIPQQPASPDPFQWAHTLHVHNGT